MSEIKMKIGYTSKGVWNESTTYDELDVVSYGHGAYSSKMTNNTGHAVTDDVYWSVLISPTDIDKIITDINGSASSAAAAATTANGVINTMSNTVSEEQFVVSATAFITCAWWGVSASPTPTAAGQYWWDGTALHVSSAVVNAQGVITGYAWSVFDLSATAVYIDGTTSAAYKYKDGAMVALTNSVAVIASQLRGINEALNKINGGV